MKSPFQLSAVLLLALAASAVSAFAPGKILSSSGKAASNYMRFARMNVKIMAGSSAKSKEEDLELTRTIIMNHIASSDTVIDDDEDDEAKSDGTVTGGKPLKKLKSLGSKIKKKLKSKLDKDE